MCLAFLFRVSLVYTIHGLRHDHFIPLVYALLPGKSEVNYRDIWTSWIASCSAKNLKLQVSVIQNFAHSVTRNISSCRYKVL